MRDFFVLDILDVVPRSDMASMEHPIFSLSTKPETRELVYEHDGNRLEIIPSVRGLPSVFDKDILIYCISKLMHMKNTGREIGPKVRLTTHDFLVATNRPTNNLGYERLEYSLERLAGTVIKTTVETGDEATVEGFSLISSFKYNRKGSMHAERLRYLEVTLCDWLFRAIDAVEVLPISRIISGCGVRSTGGFTIWRASTAAPRRSGASASISSRKNAAPSRSAKPSCGTCAKPPRRIICPITRWFWTTIWWCSCARTGQGPKSQGPHSRLPPPGRGMRL